MWNNYDPLHLYVHFYLLSSIYKSNETHLYFSEWVSEKTQLIVAGICASAQLKIQGPYILKANKLAESTFQPTNIGGKSA